MTIEYYELQGVEDTPPSELALTRSQVIYSAIQNHRDFKFIQALKKTNDGLPKLEYLVIDVSCDQVPSKNAYGISYRERLVLEISENNRQLINVIALRKDFPILLHQNQTRMGTPAQLCLYFDSPQNILRTWTPQNFLNRIIWWVEKSARGELHAADQPVEGLFFATPYELILPWNFSEQKKAGAHFTFLRGATRADKGMTFFAWPSDSMANHPYDKNVDVIELDLPAIIHSQVEQDPFTLGDLVDLFNSKNIELIALLKTQLRVQDGAVIDLTTDQNMVLVLMHIPIKRNQDSNPESISHRAFIIPVGKFQLGISIGILTKLENQVLNDVLGQIDMSANALWRLQKIDSLSVSYFSTPEKARLRSGIHDAGPSGVLVGVGALGSAMLDLWVRSGWGNWYVIDQDHLKPHNLIRHTGLAVDVGMAKVDVAAQHCQDVMMGAMSVKPIFGDAADPSNEAFIEIQKQSTLIIDASTTLEYPRLISKRDDMPRHISVFVTPNGNSAVMLAEDQQRNIRLRTLEAQYYRGLINNNLGHHNIHESMGTFMSGTSCRDISTIMPYSKILNHSSTLAEQIIGISKNEFATIRVWNRSDIDGSVTFHQLTPELELCLAIDNFDIYLDKGVEMKIKSLREHAFPNETGGILLGYHDFNINAIVVVDALAAPHDSKASPISFQRGVEGVKENVRNVSKLTGDMVGYIGEWHSHPPGHSSQPSQDDFFQLIFLSLGMAEDGLPAISLIVGENDLQVMKCEAR